MTGPAGAGERPRADRGRAGTAGATRREFVRIAAAAGLTALLVGGIAVRILRDLRRRRVSATRVAMGTPVTITLLHAEADEGDRRADRAIQEAFVEIGRLESIFTRYRPDSPVSRLSASGILRDAPSELVDLVRRSIRFSEATGGAFDVTVAPLLDLYRTYAARGAEPPDAEVRDALALVDYRSIEVEGTTIRLERPGMAVTFDAIAKGYAMDRALVTLASFGFEHAMVEAGGDLAASVAPDGDGWEIAVQDPRRAGASLGTLRVGGASGGGEPGGAGTGGAGAGSGAPAPAAGTVGVATSGDYMEAFTADRTLHHILDPRTGRSPQELSAVTVIAPSATEADALATSALVMGRETGMALLKDWVGAEGLLVTRNGQELRTSGFPALA